jgi:hypothetical protein
MSNGVEYGMAFECYGDGNVIGRYDSSSDGTRHGTGESLPATWSGVARYRTFSVYATYTEGGGATANSYYYMMNQ